MAPASGAAVQHPVAHALVEQLGAPGALEVFEDEELAVRVKSPQLLAALALLTGSPAEPVMLAFRHHGATVEVVACDGLVDHTLVSGEAESPMPPRTLVVNERFAAEHPALLAPTLAAGLCHHDADPFTGASRAGAAERATLGALAAATHIWLLQRIPALADLGTELARRNNSLAMALLNGRAPGSDRAAVVCPAGPGVAPGGSVRWQVPDLWSLPPEALGEPGAPAEQECNHEVPPPVAESLILIAAPGAPVPPLRYDDGLRDWLAEHTCGGLLDAPTRLAAGRVLGLHGA